MRPRLRMANAPLRRVCCDRAPRDEEPRDRGHLAHVEPAACDAVAWFHERFRRSDR